jgi:hypothetical protein
MRVCKECGSDEIYYDAWVNVNDSEHIITFDFVYCMICEAKATDIPKEVYDGQSAS